MIKVIKNQVYKRIIIYRKKVIKLYSKILCVRILYKFVERMKNMVKSKNIII